MSESRELREKYAKVLRKLEGHEKKIKSLEKQLEEKNEEMMHIHIEPDVSHGPPSDLSSGNYQTPLTSLSQSAELEQQDPPRLEGPNVLLQLQNDNEAKQQQIIKLNQEVTQLKRRFDHAGGLEEQLTRLTMEASNHEEEKRKLQQRIEQLQRGVQPQPPHHGETDETQKLKEALQEKESEIRQLRKQQESHQKTATEFGVLQEHSKKQSKQMMQLRSHVDAAKVSGFLGSCSYSYYLKYLCISVLVT